VQARVGELARRVLTDGVEDGDDVHGFVARAGEAAGENPDKSG